jgi:hypothetical protein
VPTPTPVTTAAPPRGPRRPLAAITMAPGGAAICGADTMGYFEFVDLQASLLQRG